MDILKIRNDIILVLNNIYGLKKQTACSVTLFMRYLSEWTYYFIFMNLFVFFLIIWSISWVRYTKDLFSTKFY